MKGLFEQPADIVPDEKEGILSVNFHPMANPRFNRALRDLYAVMNAEAFFFPQTKLKMNFNVPTVAETFSPFQEP